MIAGLDPSHGGPTYSTPRLCAALAAAGREVALYYVKGRRPPILPEPLTFEVNAFAWDWADAPLLRSLRLSAGLDRALQAAATSASVIHNHGLWLTPNLSAARAAARGGAPFVCSPRGMLSLEALAFSATRKKLMWRLAQRKALETAACLHATSEAERDDIRQAGLAAPVAVIPNGIDLPPPRPCRPPGPIRTVLALGRIHPKKNLEALLQAWARVQSGHPNWRVRIVGPAELGYDAKLAALARSLNLERLTVDAPVYGAERDALLGEVDLFVMPTRSENFGIVVGEALAAQVPVICSKGAPWAGLETQGCGWWIDHGPEPLAVAMGAAMQRPPEVLAAMGERGRAWVERDFSWGRIAEQMAAVYDWLAGAADRPDVVRLD